MVTVRMHPCPNAVSVAAGSPSTHLATTRSLRGPERPEAISPGSPRPLRGIHHAALGAGAMTRRTNGATTTTPPAITAPTVSGVPAVYPGGTPEYGQTTSTRPGRLALAGSAEPTSRRST